VLQNLIFFALASRSGCGAAISDAVARSSSVFRKSVSADRIVVAASRFSLQWFLCARDFSVAVKALWHAEELRWIERSFDEMSKVEQCSSWAVEKNLDDIWEEMRWDEMRWDEKSWDEVRRAQMRWDEVWSAKCKCEVWSVKSVVWSVEFQARPLGQCITVAQSTRARAWLAHGACKFYRWEKSYNISLRQLPPRLVRVLLVPIAIGLGWDPVVAIAIALGAACTYSFRFRLRSSCSFCYSYTWNRHRFDGFFLRLPLPPSFPPVPHI